MISRICPELSVLIFATLSGTARELFRESGCSDRVYQDAFNPMLLVGLFAPGELCSAAACLGMLYYFILAHQVPPYSASSSISLLSVGWT